MIEKTGMDREGGSVGSCYYAVIGICKDASSSDIRTAYRKLALKWHPDRWAKNSAVAGEANRRFQKIQEAYSVLSDEGKRSMYDAGVLDLFDEDEESVCEEMNEMNKCCADFKTTKTPLWRVGPDGPKQCSKKRPRQHLGARPPGRPLTA
ncbi:uncharacterized protein LOC130778476 isoform X2 [Actinidia eriantha]|uniref:uncharacterized protein LOC130778476 isoform X2 n=1 Tax=Actinidia eriantha TaxID=165200 RepID=UPI00258EEFE9|nr:uncharacterized protein LOC130778476 isoform X2 [Actinidia eriantha]